MFVTLRDGLRLHVRVEGTGDPLLLLHGFTESVEAWGVRIRMTWYQLVTDYLQVEPEQLDLIGKERVA